MSRKVRFVGFDRAERSYSGRAPQVITVRPAPAMPYLRRLRSWISGTHDLTQAQVLDKIDDLIHRAEQGE